MQRLLFMLAGLLALAGTAYMASPHVTAPSASQSAATTVSAAPVITVQPSSQTIPEGGQFNVHVKVESATPVSYAWYRNGNLITGYNAFMWYVASARAGVDAGTYYVVVTNTAGSVTSATATITVGSTATSVAPVTATPTPQLPQTPIATPTPTPAPTQAPTPAPTTKPTIAAPLITTQPFASTPSATARTVTLKPSGYLYIFVGASGAAPLSYTWYKNGTALAGNNVNYLWFNPAQQAQAGEYSVVVKNAGGSMTSNKVIVHGPTPTPTPTPFPTPVPAPTPTQTPSPTPTPASGKVKLGACGNCDGIAGVEAFEKFMGRKADYVLVWGWADTANNFVYSAQYLDEMWPRDTYYLHWSMPLIIDGTKFKDVTDGTYDHVYRAIAQRIASRDPNAIVRMGHEMNGNWYAWSQDGPAGTAAEYAAAFRHIVNIYRSVSPNFKFVWNPGAGKWAGIDYITTYPGDAYVDYISYDQYEDKKWLNGTAAERWQHFLVNEGRGLNFLADFAAQHGKQIAFDEWATDYDDGSYITNMYNWMQTHNVAYQMYWNSEAAFSGSFAVHPGNGAIFKQLFGK